MSYSDDMMIDNRNSVFHNNSVDDMLSKLVAEAKNYDVYNLIQRIACLNLFHQNQNKAVIFDAFLDALLQHKAEEFASEHPMSCGKFRKFLCGLIETSLGASIDPPENLFVQNVMFYGNYEVFNGIDYHPAYNLQMIIRTVFETSNSLPIEFKKRVFRLVNYVLRKSNHIANSLDSTENNHVEDEARSLYIPASSIIERYAALVVLQGSEVRAALENDAQLLEMIVTRFGESGESDFDNRCFYRAPLLYNPHKDEYIILNIGLLITALFYWILCLAEKYGVQQKLLADFNECTFYHCQKYLKRLGHLKIKESQFDISLANELYYKEWIGTVHNNQLLVMLYLCDEGVGINADSMHSCVQTDKYGNTINDRMQELVSKLTKHGVQDKDIYFVFVINGIGRSISFGIHKNSTPHALLTFAPMELMCISINEERDSAFLPRYIDAKSSFSQSFNGMISELNAIELYTSQDYSFYLGDDIDPAEISMFFAPGDSIDYIKRALTKEDRRLVEAFEGNRYAEVVLDDQKRKIYIDTTITKEIKLSYYLNFNWFSLWVTTDPITDYRAIEIYHTFTDTIAYWLAELRPYMESVKGEENQALQICVQLSDEIDEYKYDRERVGRLNDCLKISSENNSIRLLCSADVLRYLNFDDNTHEKEFIQIMLRKR